MYTVSVRDAPERFFKALNETDQAAVDRLVGLIRLDPKIDGVHKFMFASEVVIFTVYDNGSWTIIYRIDGTDIQIWGIERSDPERRSSRAY